MVCLSVGLKLWPCFESVSVELSVAARLGQEETACYLFSPPLGCVTEFVKRVCTRIGCDVSQEGRGRQPPRYAVVGLSLTLAGNTYSVCAQVLAKEIQTVNVII